MLQNLKDDHLFSLLVDEMSMFLTTCHQSVIYHKKATKHTFFSSTQTQVRIMTSFIFYDREHGYTQVRMTSFIFTVKNMGMHTSLVCFCWVTQDIIRTHKW